jgi:hypothetical protein
MEWSCHGALDAVAAPLSLQTRLGFLLICEDYTCLREPQANSFSHGQSIAAPEKRGGFITEAANAGVRSRDIMAQTDHKSKAVMRGHIQQDFLHV